MLVVWTLKGRADAFGQLVSAEQPIGFYHFCACRESTWAPWPLSQGLLVGK